MARDDTSPTESWHLDKRVNVGIIFAILLQTAGALWWAAKMDSRVRAVEQFRDDSKGDPARLAVLESQISGIAESIRDVKDILRRFESKLDGNGVRQ